MEHCKTPISLLFCISADGKILSSFLVYRAQNENWYNAGPPGAKYDATE